MLGPTSVTPVPDARVTTWSPERLRLAARAVVVAAATGAFVVLVTGGGLISGAVLYALLGLLGLFFPLVVTVQAVVGQLLLATALLGPESVAPLLLVPPLAGLVATTELLAAVARLHTPLRHDVRAVLPRAGFAAAVGGATFGLVASIRSIPGPTGLLAIALASLACVGLATLLHAPGARHPADALSWARRILAREGEDG